MLPCFKELYVKRVYGVGSTACFIMRSQLPLRTPYRETFARRYTKVTGKRVKLY